MVRTPESGIGLKFPLAIGDFFTVTAIIYVDFQIIRPQILADRG